MSATGRYSNVSDFVRDLGRREQKRREKIAAMQQLVDEARATGVSERGMTDIREGVLRRAGVTA